MAEKKKRKNPAAVALGRKGGKRSRANLTAQQRKELAQKAAGARWGKRGTPPADSNSQGTNQPRYITITLDTAHLTEDEVDYLYCLKRKHEPCISLDEVMRQIGYEVVRDGKKSRLKRLSNPRQVGQTTPRRKGNA